MRPAFLRWTLSSPFAGRVTLFTPICAICHARPLALTRPLCTLIRTSLLSFHPLALPKQVIGTLLVKTFPFLFLFFVMFLHFSAHNFGTQRANFATQRSSLNNCFSCHVMSIVSTSSCFQFILEPLNHVVRQHVRALKCTRVGPTTAIKYLFSCPHVKRAPQLFVFWYTRYRLHNDSAGFIRCVYSKFEPSSFHLAEVYLFPPAFLLCCAQKHEIVIARFPQPTVKLVLVPT